MSGSNGGAMASEKNMSVRRYDFDRVMRLLVSVGTLVGVVWLLRYLSDVLVPFTIALLIAYLLHPTVSLVERWLKNRSAAVLVTVIGGLGVMLMVVVLSMPILAAQLGGFRKLLSELRADSVSTVSQGDTSGAAAPSFRQRFDALIEAQTDDRARWVLEKIRESVASGDLDLEARAIELAKELAPGVWGVLTGAVNFLLGLVGLVVVLLYVVFLLNDFRLVERAWKDQLPPAYREPVVQFLDEFRIAMSRYFRGQFVVACCVGVLFAIGFSIIGLRMGIVLGLFVGVLNMVPYLQLLGLIPAGLLAVLRAVEHDSSMATSLLLAAAVFIVVQAIQDSVLTPRILGKATGLRPAIILLGVCIWGKVLGFLGLVLAIPLTCLGLAYYRRWILRLRNVTVVQADGA